jgi:hypothetical protein
VPAGDDPDELAQAMPTHGGTVAAAAGGRDWAATAIEVDDLAMSEPDQVIDGLTQALVVRGPDDVHRCVRYSPADDDHRQAPGQ